MEIFEEIRKKIKELEELQKQKDKKIRELEKEKGDLRQSATQDIDELRNELDGLTKKIEELKATLHFLTEDRTQPVGILVQILPDKRVLILDNSGKRFNVPLDEGIDPETLFEGSDVEYTADKGVPIAVFNVMRRRRKEEIATVVKLINGKIALITIGDRMNSVVNIGQQAKELTEGDRVYYNPEVHFIVEKVPKEEAEEKVDLSQVERKTWADIGGLAEQVRKIKEIVELPLQCPEVFEQLGVKPTKGILLHGPPGSGKTLLGRIIANETEAFFIYIAASDVITSYVGESEANLRAIFQVARKNSPAIIFFDEIESIAQKREEMHTGQLSEQRVVAQLLALLDGLETRAGVIVIAATNVPDLLDPALRRPGRLDIEIEIPIPDRDGRFDILKIHSRKMPLTKETQAYLEELADKTHGYSGADLENLCREAAMSVIRERNFINLSPEAIKETLKRKLTVAVENFEGARIKIVPSSLREAALVQKPKETWADVGGLEEVKQKLEQAIGWRLKYPHLIKAAGLPPVKGVLLVGPPGCGKTLLAKAFANECGGVNFIAVKGPELLEKWFGGSEGNVRKIFKKARQSAPCVIFFDEIDALVGMRGVRYDNTGVRDSVTAQILTEWDGIEDLKGVFILAATNRPDLIDPALLRTGRFDEIISIPPPDEPTRRKILEIHLKGKPLGDDIDLDFLAKKTVLPAGSQISVYTTMGPQIAVLKRDQPFSGSDIAAVCSRAVRKALEEWIATRENPEESCQDFRVAMKHFMAVIEEMTAGSQTEKRDIKPLTSEDIDKILGD